jgi:AraC-like DNA-binding protein
MDGKRQLFAQTAHAYGSGEIRTVKMTQVKFGENAEAQQFQGVGADQPRAELPVAEPVAEKRAADALGEALTIRQVARLLGCSVWTVRQRYLVRGLPYFRIGSIGKLVFYRAQVTRWILEQQEHHTGRR